MGVFKKKAQKRSDAIELVHSRVAALLDTVPAASSAPPVSVDLSGTLDPAAGDLSEARAARKRAQIRSAAAHATRLLRTGDHCVEFGAGSGHLGLVVAAARPDVHVTLVEIKDGACERARRRLAELDIRNCAVFCGSVDDFAATGALIDCVLGLHLCGLLTDSVLELAVARRAAVCVVPCCYGQIVGAIDHARGGSTAPCMHPRSAVFRRALEARRDDEACVVCDADGASNSRRAAEGGSGSAIEAFRTVARAADIQVVGKGGEFDVDGAPPIA